MENIITLTEKQNAKMIESFKAIAELQKEADEIKQKADEQITKVEEKASFVRKSQNDILEVLLEVSGVSISDIKEIKYDNGKLVYSLKEVVPVMSASVGELEPVKDVPEMQKSE